MTQSLYTFYARYCPLDVIHKVSREGCNFPPGHLASLLFDFLSNRSLQPVD